ncbi:hypothetical protein CTEN210_03385 [Chaetoceros tenuissimus]|uniref:Mannosyltransferase n=1 Tax=Chaetoceros tenuissimus TaxID=426638 RepID=A0AAD3CL63_9STRA|nr:hypothetical protein CTEN210_03385 [Chaetoceros tenuissimus]
MRSILYLILLVLRLILVIQPGYIHPDEFFQGGQELFFGIPKQKDTIQNSIKQPTSYMKISLINENMYKSPIVGIKIDGITATWEFQVGNELRSIVPPTIMTLIPTWIYSIIFKKCDSDQLLHECLTGFEILIIPRLFMAILSMLSVDICIWYISNAKKRSNDFKESRSVLNISGELLVLASSWVTLCFLNRPFTNSLETMCLSMLCMVVVRDFKFLNVRQDSLKPSLLNPLLMGVIGAFGLWTRFTFCIFAFPAVVCFFLERWSSMKGLFEKLRITMTTFLTIATSFTITSLYFIYEDSRFYNLLQALSNGELPENLLSISITPWNAFRYNSKVSNLNDHGLHPRYLHVLVNLPMLFGPLCIIFFYNLLKRYSSKKSKSRLGERIDRMMYSILLFGIFVLSCAPHQEPRFLVPLTIPVVVIFGEKILHTEKYRRSLVAIWILFNIACFIFFGTLHQGSIQSSLLTMPQLISSKSVTPSTIVYYKTYMPPTFLYQHLQHDKAFQCQESNDFCLSSAMAVESSSSNMEILDAHDTPLDDLMNMLKSALSSSEALNNSLYLVAPRTIVERLPLDDFFVDELWGSFQISTENPPDNSSLSTIYEDFKLCIYNIVMKM